MILRDLLRAVKQARLVDKSVDEATLYLARFRKGDHLPRPEVEADLLGDEELSEILPPEVVDDGGVIELGEIEDRNEFDLTDATVSTPLSTEADTVDAKPRRNKKQKRTEE